MKNIERNGCMNGIGKPELLTGDLQGEYSRRINEKDRLVYHMENGRLYIVHCGGIMETNNTESLPPAAFLHTMVSKKESLPVSKIPACFPSIFYPSIFPDKL